MCSFKLCPPPIKKSFLRLCYAIHQTFGHLQSVCESTLNGFSNAVLQMWWCNGDVIEMHNTNLHELSDIHIKFYSLFTHNVSVRNFWKRHTLEVATHEVDTLDSTNKLPTQASEGSVNIIKLTTSLKSPSITSWNLWHQHNPLKCTLLPTS